MNDYTRGEYYQDRSGVAVYCDVDPVARFAKRSDADHIVALHNACERAGITNPAAIPDLVAAAKRLVEINIGNDRELPANSLPASGLAAALADLKAEHHAHA